VAALARPLLSPIWIRSLDLSRTSDSKPQHESQAKKTWPTFYNNMRIPTAKDFPSSITHTLIPESPSSQPTPSNILILLHGLGDTHLPFANLARQLSLPQTMSLSLLGPTPIPHALDMGDGSHWADDILFDPSPSASPIELDAGFTRARKLIVEQVVQSVLIGKCDVKLREIMLFGFGQGGMAALAAAMALADETATGGEMGGVVCIGGYLPTDAALSEGMKKAGKKCRTPVLVCAGSRGTAVSGEKVKKLKEVFSEVELVRWQREGDGMPRSREEMLPIMRFFARRLRSRAGVPEGAVEIGG
jgi:predicted esterase